MKKEESICLLKSNISYKQQKKNPQSAQKITCLKVATANQTKTVINLKIYAAVLYLQKATSQDLAISAGSLKMATLLQDMA